MIYQVISQSKIVWTMYFVDIVVSYGFFVLLCSELISFSLCLPLMLVNKVDH